MREGDVFRQVETLRRADRTAEVTVSALAVHTRAATRCDRAGFLADGQLDALAGPRDATLAAVELCLAGVWRRTDGGYVVTRARGWGRVTAAARRVWIELNSERFIP